MTEARKAATERRRHTRRRKDFYKELGKLAGLVGCVIAAILGQAELIGEPYRHVLAITGIGATAIFGYCMTPRSIKQVMTLMKGLRRP